MIDEHEYSERPQFGTGNDTYGDFMTYALRLLEDIRNEVRELRNDVRRSYRWNYNG